MSWLRTVLGLIGEAVRTEAGREVIRNVRAAIKKAPPHPTAAEKELSLADVEALIAEYRTEMNSNLEKLVQDLRSQNMKLAEVVRRQRLWNVGLTGGMVAAFLIALLT